MSKFDWDMEAAHGGSEYSPRCVDCREDWADVGMCCVYKVLLCQTCFRAREDKLKSRTF
jgi:hypothetical protein